MEKDKELQAVLKGERTGLSPSLGADADTCLGLATPSQDPSYRIRYPTSDLSSTPGQEYERWRGRSYIFVLGNGSEDVRPGGRGALGRLSVMTTLITVTASDAFTAALGRYNADRQWTLSPLARG